MADHTGIEWADATWNPIVGCSIVSPGCTNCYAMGQAARIERMQPASHYAGTTQPSKAGAVWSGKLAPASEHIFTLPLRWRRPRRIFVNSMGDLFHEGHPEEAIDHVFAVMALAPQHTYMVLTKRSARMRAYLSDPDTHHRICVAACEMAMELDLRVVLLAHPSLEPHAPPAPRVHLYRWPLPNVWLGVSTERQPEWDARVPDLKATPAAVRFVSAEPLLGPIVGDFYLINLAIVGGESGPKARPMHPDWARSLRDQCAAAGTAFFFKQWGEFAPQGLASEAWHVSPDGMAVPDPLPNGVGRHVKEGHWRAYRVGKRAAGRLLDGVEHNAMPEARP